MAKHSFTYKFSAVAFFVLAGLAVQSCESRGTDMASVYGPPAQFDAKNAFGSLSASVLKPQCVKCHSEFNSPDGVNAQIVPGDPDHSPLYIEVEHGDMPKNGTHLPDSLCEIVRAYIENLKPGSDQPPIDLNRVNFQVLSSAIFQPRCIKCHQDDFSTADETLADIEPGDPEHSILYNYVIAHGEKPPRMPKNGVALSANYAQAISAYIQSLPPKIYPPVAPTWSSINANLIQRSCIQCHNDPSNTKVPAFDTVYAVQNFDSKIMDKMIAPRNAMPPAHTTLPPTPELIQAFSDWMNAGEPAN